MVKPRVKALTQAIDMTVALRRKVVDVRLERTEESGLLDKTTELLGILEGIQKRLEEEWAKDTADWEAARDK